MFVLWRRLFRALCEGMSGYKEWFVELGMDEEEIINRICGDELDRTKGRILRKLEGKGERIKEKK